MQQLKQMSLDKSEELGCQYTWAYVLVEDNNRLLTQISEVNAWVDELEERNHVREEELAQARRERDRQRSRRPSYVRRTRRSSRGTRHSKQRWPSSRARSLSSRPRRPSFNARRQPSPRSP